MIQSAGFQLLNEDDEEMVRKRLEEKARKQLPTGKSAEEYKAMMRAKYEAQLRENERIRQGLPPESAEGEEPVAEKKETSSTKPKKEEKKDKAEKKEEKKEKEDKKDEKKEDKKDEKKDEKKDKEDKKEKEKMKKSASRKSKHTAKDKEDKKEDKKEKAKDDTPVGNKRDSVSYFFDFIVFDISRIDYCVSWLWMPLNFR